MESFALEKLAVKLNGTPLGAKDSPFTSLQDSRTCDENSLCFVRDSKFLATLSPNAGAVITQGNGRMTGWQVRAIGFDCPRRFAFTPAPAT